MKEPIKQGYGLDKVYSYKEHPDKIFVTYNP